MSQTVANAQAVSEQFETVEEAPNDNDGVPTIKTPQGSMASEIQPGDDQFSDNDRSSENDFHPPSMDGRENMTDAPIADDISQLKLDADEVKMLRMEFNHYSRI